MSDLNLADIQGNLLLGYKFPHVAHRFGEVKAGDPSDVEAWRSFIGALHARVTSASWAKEPRFTINVGFSYRALAALQPALAKELAKPFSAFADGMPARAAGLGDGDEFQRYRWEARQVWVSIHAKDETALSEGQSTLKALAEPLILTGDQPGEAIVKNGNWHEHFGFRDDISYPAFVGIPTLDQEDINGRGKLVGGAWQALSTGEFLLGYENEAGVDPLTELSDAARRLLHNGTFAVFRHLRQHVAAFRRYVEEQSGRLSARELAEGMMGRRENGEPFVPVAPEATGASELSYFDYRDDPKGAKCPLGSHVRRANPRNADGRHRLIRRGIPHGKELLPGAEEQGQERGLWFVAFNANIEDQFEFIQKVWCNGAVGTLTNACDPIASAVPIRAMAIEGDVASNRAPRLLLDLPKFVSCHGGQYYLYPGFGGLELLGSSAPQSTPHV